MAKMLGRAGKSSYFCVFGWRCGCERRRTNKRRGSGVVVDASRRQLRRREGREFLRELEREDFGDV